MMSALKEKAAALKQELKVLMLAFRDPRLPLRTKILTAAVLAYALSPVDLIPDFIPLLGYLDDLILIPAGIALIRRSIPPEILEDCRHRTDESPTLPGGRWIAAGIIVVLQAAFVFFLLRLILLPLLER